MEKLQHCVCFFSIVIQIDYLLNKMIVLLFAVPIMSKTEEECAKMYCNLSLIPVCAGDDSGTADQYFSHDCAYKHYICLNDITGKVIHKELQFIPNYYNCFLQII